MFDVIAISLNRDDPRVCDYCNDLLVEKGLTVRACHTTEDGLMCDECLKDTETKPIKSYPADTDVSRESWYDPCGDYKPYGDDFISQYERNERKRSEKRKQATSEAQEALEKLTDLNRQYLKYAEAKGHLKLSEMEREAHARINAIVTLAGCWIRWDLDKAVKVAYGVLEDVNHHSLAKAFLELAKNHRP